MNKDIITAAIVSLPATLTALGGLVAVFRKINNLHQEINSRMDQLLLAEKSVSKSEGIEQQRNSSAV